MKFAAALAFNDPTHFLELARTADEAGWDWFAVSDHIVFPEKLSSAYPYAKDGKPYWTGATPWPDPWTAIAAMAAVTSRLRFMTNIYILPARNPLLIAKQIGTVAVMSGGRVALGIGTGWMKEEFELLGTDFHTRGKRMDEQVEILRKLWRGGMQEHHGKHYSFDRLEMSPVPTEPVPVLVGGISDIALKRAARIGDGWIAVQHTTSELRELLGKLGALRKEFGTDSRPFEAVVACTDVFDVDGYRRIEDLGATTMTTAPWMLYGADPNSLEEKKDALKRFGDEVISRFKG
ncbi:MAG TPA: LLM class F420-dependent oxidoreductase [Candidatus Binatia bacterium]